MRFLTNYHSEDTKTPASTIMQILLWKSIHKTMGWYTKKLILTQRQQIVEISLFILSKKV